MKAAPVMKLLPSVVLVAEGLPGKAPDLQSARTEALIGFPLSNRVISSAPLAGIQINPNKSD